MNSKALTAAAIAGVAIGLLSGLPLIGAVNCLLCAWVWGGGIFAIWLYKRQSGATSVETGQGAMIGGVAGVVGGLISGLLGMLFSGGTAATIAQLRSTLPPEQLEAMGPMLDAMASGGVGIAAICFSVGIFAIFGVIGGLIGAATIGKQKQITGGTL